MRAVMNLTPMAPMAPTKVTMPDSKAVIPKPICIIRGSRKGVAPMPSRASVAEMLLARKVAIAKSFGSSTGRAVRFVCSQYSQMQTTPAVTATKP